MIKFRSTLLTLVATITVVLLATPQASQAVPRRVISLVPAVTEMLFAIGAGPEVVGVSSFDRYPPEALKRPSVGALIDPDFERILTLKPDLVITYGSQAELLSRLERSSIPAYPYRLGALVNVTATIRELGRRLGRQTTADALAIDIERQLDAIRRRRAGGDRPSTAIVFGREPGTLRGVYVSGGIGFLHDLVELAGGRNVFGDVQRENLQVSSEQILARAPQVILELRSSDLSTERVQQERAAWRALSSVPAVRDGRVHVLADDKLAIPGPRVVESARAVEEALHRSGTPLDAQTN